MTYEYHGGDTDNIAGCTGTGCHSSVSDFDVNGVQTAVEAKIVTLRGLLVGIGILDATDHSVPGTYPANEASALFNFLMVLEDRSNGVHNPAYVIDLLDDTIDEVTP
jgi:hypothetical protein